MKQFIVMGMVLLVTSTVYFGCRTHREEDSAKRMAKHADWITEKIIDELDLTAEQQKTLNSIKGEIVAKQSEMKLLREGVVNDLFSVLDKETITEEELNIMFSAREEAWKELRQFAVAKYTQFHNSLTKEQRAVLKEKLEKFKKYRG